jgi:hypothetical protein
VGHVYWWNSTAAQEKLLWWLSSHVLSDSNWTEGVDDPSDTTGKEQGDMGDPSPDRLNFEEGKALLNEIEKNPSPWPTWIHSQVLMDIWHAMTWIKVSKEHGSDSHLLRLYEMLCPDLDDKKLTSIQLVPHGMMFSNLMQNGYGNDASAQFHPQKCYIPLSEKSTSLMDLFWILKPKSHFSVIRHGKMLQMY